MIEMRVTLLQALEQVARGDPFGPTELVALAAKERGLAGLDRRAYEALRHWSDDEGMRAKDARYAARQQREIEALLTELARATNSEAEDGLA